MRCPSTLKGQTLTRIASGVMPYSYTKGGEWKGIEHEILDVVADHFGISFQTVFVPNYEETAASFQGVLGPGSNKVKSKINIL